MMYCTDNNVLPNSRFHLVKQRLIEAGTLSSNGISTAIKNSISKDRLPTSGETGTQDILSGTTTGSSSSSGSAISSLQLQILEYGLLWMVPSTILDLDVVEWNLQYRLNWSKL